MEEKKKKTKRSDVKYPGLVKEVHPKPRWEFIDFDYTEKLSPKEKEFLSNFNEEWLSGNFNHKGKKFHKTKKEKKTCYDRNNARNRDVYAINRTRGWISSTETAMENIKESKRMTDGHSTEDTLIALIEIKDKIKKS